MLKFCLVFLSARFWCLWRKYVYQVGSIMLKLRCAVAMGSMLMNQQCTSHKVFLNRNTQKTRLCTDQWWKCGDQRHAGTYLCIFPRSSSWCSITQWSQPLYRIQVLQITRINCYFCHLLRRRIMGATVWWGWDESHQALTSLFMLYGLLSSTGFVLKMSWGESCCLAVDGIPWEPLACLGSIWGTTPCPLPGS